MSDSDTDDFMAAASNRSHGEDSKDSNKAFEKKDSTPESRDEDREDSGLQNGKLVQWSHNGPGFVPATKTSQKLPASVYNIEFLGNIATFVPHRLVTDNLLRLPDSKSDEVIADIEK